MAAPAEYVRTVASGWLIFSSKDTWNAKLRADVLTLVQDQAPARHPQTIEVAQGRDGIQKALYLKVFHRRSLAAVVKDQFRSSRALGSWRQGIALTEAGFKAPSTLAVGVERRWRIARREFLLTAKVPGVGLTTYLCGEGGPRALSLSFKRDCIRRLARLLKRFHDAGFVHGDLVATNIFIMGAEAGDTDFCFMDNDRTRRYPVWLKQSFWKRNLIQLSRMPLPGISLQDRMRFLHAYLGVKRLSERDRQFSRWLEARTRRRRMECDGVDPSGSFRRLMRWSPEMAQVKPG